MRVTESLRRQWHDQRSQMLKEREFTQTGLPRDPAEITEVDFAVAMLDRMLELPLGAWFLRRQIQKELLTEMKT
jgi:hypothetical protein